MKTTINSKGNIIIKKPAKTGMENPATVILKIHLDMVHQKIPTHSLTSLHKASQCTSTETKSRLKTTILGADNGIEVAAIIAILSDKYVLHPLIESLFTTDEKDGMGGAKHLNARPLSRKTLLQSQH
ncbi:MAG: hypothetical protein ACMUEM_01045 [Flavobacteriales bacterium AspAUS03]